MEAVKLWMRHNETQEQEHFLYIRKFNNYLYLYIQYDFAYNIFRIPSASGYINM